MDERSYTDISTKIDVSSSQPNHIPQKKAKRPICQGCNLPSRTCICKSLPEHPLHPLFQRSRIIVLQHPHEFKRKNRSMPLVDLCLFGKGYKQEAANDNNVQHDSTDTTQVTDFVMKTIVGRRFGIYTDANVMKILHDPNEVVVLVFPHKQAMDLEEGIRLAEERCGYNTGCKESSNLKDTSDIEEHYINKKMTLIFIDATWKHAREMESASAVEWPKDLIRVQLKPSESTAISGGNAQSHHDDSANGKTKTEASSNDGRLTFIERRFQIRAPPSPDHLSTAECLAWIASRVEHNPHIYQSILKTLDYMVNIWKDITEQSAAADSNNRKKRKKCKPMSQKKLKISKS